MYIYMEAAIYTDPLKFWYIDAYPGVGTCLGHVSLYVYVCYSVPKCMYYVCVCHISLKNSAPQIIWHPLPSRK